MLPSEDRTNILEQPGGYEPARLLALLDDRGELITSVRFVGAAGRTVEIAVDRHSYGTLLAYLYGKGRRRVALESNGVRLTGRLSTEWRGHRRWFVRLEPATSDGLPGELAAPHVRNE